MLSLTKWAAGLFIPESSGFRLFASSVSPYYVALPQLADSDTQD